MKQVLRAAAVFFGVASSLVFAQTKPAKQKPLMRDFVGINAHTIQFDPKLYAPLGRLVRDYHPFAWDVDGDTSKFRPFPVAQHIDWEDKTGKFRSWHKPVDWDELYGSWRKEGYEIDACIQFDGTRDLWKNPADDAYRYGKAFAEHFGPTKGNGLVTSVEIGNEPAGNNHFPPDAYAVIFDAMAKGVRDGDAKLKILTAAVDAVPADKSDGWSYSLDLFKTRTANFDVINLHRYALAEGWPSFRRTNPEDAKLGYAASLQRSIDWRNAHAPGKEIWVTEFGFDATTKPPADPKWVSATDYQQAQWIVRSLLLMASLDLDRAYLYWFNDDDTPSFHGSSGVTRNFTPKPSYYALRHFYQTLKDFRFARVVKQTDKLWIFEFEPEKAGQPKIWVAWSPTALIWNATLMPIPSNVMKAEQMPISGRPVNSQIVEDEVRGSRQVPIDESPVYLWIRE